VLPRRHRGNPPRRPSADRTRGPSAVRDALPPARCGAAVSGIAVAARAGSQGNRAADSQGVRAAGEREVMTDYTNLDEAVDYLASVYPSWTRESIVAMSEGEHPHGKLASLFPDEIAGPIGVMFGNAAERMHNE